MDEARRRTSLVKESEASEYEYDVGKGEDGSGNGGEENRRRVHAVAGLRLFLEP